MSSFFDRVFGNNDAPAPEEVLEKLEKLQKELSVLITQQTRTVELLPSIRRPYHLSFYVAFAILNLSLSAQMYHSNENFAMVTRFSHYILTVFSVTCTAVYALGRNKCGWKVVSAVEASHSYVALIMGKVALCFFGVLVLHIFMAKERGRSKMLWNIYSHYITTAIVWILEPQMKNKVGRLFRINLFVIAVCIFFRFENSDEKPRLLKTLVASLLSDVVLLGLLKCSSYGKDDAKRIEN